MKRLALLVSFALLTTVSLTSCKKKDGETTDPDSETEEKEDALTQLKAVPADIQGEIDLVLKPIKDAEELMAKIETAPETLKISAPELKGLLKAAFDADVKADGEGVEANVSVDLSALDITAEARAELQAMIDLIREIKVGLLATPENVVTATTNIVAHGARATTLGASATASIQAKMTVAMGGKKDELQGQLNEITQIQADVTASVADAKATVTGIPAEATSMGAKLAASFAGSASAGKKDGKK
jgi:hypothetical protein